MFAIILVQKDVSPMGYGIEEVMEFCVDFIDNLSQIGSLCHAMRGD